ncbi:hypothetical protein FZC66_17825 [Priestia megaterium]|nr:hypothetical protein FZC66_17825 [Priestia megaterium]
MKKYLNSIVFFLKLNSRNPLYITSLILVLSYLGVIIYTYTSSEITDPGNMLQLSSFLIQGYMLAFMFLGFHTMSAEMDKGSKELFLTIPKSFYIKIASNLSAVGAINFIFCIFSTILILTVYKLTGYAFSSLYTKSVAFVFIYWFLPALISALMGALIGLTMNKKFSPAVIIGVWLLISPMNIYFSHQLFKVLGFKYVPGFLHLGVPDPKMSYNAFSGFVFTQEDLINKFVWVISLLLAFSLILMLKRKNVKNSLILLSILFLFVGSSHFFFIDSKSNPSKFHERNIEELNYYAENDYHQPKTSMDYTIKKYDIDLEITNQLEALVQIQFSKEEEGKRSFSLYHGFDVTSIKDESGKSIKHEQYGDFIDIELDQPTEKLIFQYSGLSSPYMDANQYAAYLPYYFAWIPLKSEHPTMKFIYNSNNRLPSQPNTPIEYALTFNGAKDIITNLEKVEKGKYAGLKESGISFIYGEIKTNKIDGYDITYPVTWENSMPAVDSYVEQIEESFSMIKNVFELKGAEPLPNKILFIPTRGANDSLASETMWLQEGEQLIILIDPYEHHDEETFERKKYLIPYQMISALLWKKNRVVFENNDIPIIFNYLAGAYMNKQAGGAEWSSFEKEFWIDEILFETNSESHKQLIQEVNSFVCNAPAEKVEDFLLQWSKLLNKPDVNWMEIDNLLQAYK